MFSSSRTLPGKRVALQVARRVTEASRGGVREPRARRQPREDRIGQHRDVVAPLAQRRQLQLDDVEPVEEVLAEAAAPHALRQVLVRRADDAHVDRLFDRRADLAGTLFLDRAQQLDLHRQRQVGDLVEEQRAAVGGLEEAVALLVGTGEGPLAVTEELGLHQVLGNGAAVDRDERAWPRAARFVDQARRELLAGAGFAGDRHRRHAARQPQDLRAHVTHRLGFAEQRRARGSTGAAAWPARCGIAAADCTAERTRLRSASSATRLGQVVEGARLQRGHRILGAAVGGDHGHRRVGIVGGDQCRPVRDRRRRAAACRSGRARRRCGPGSARASARSAAQSTSSPMPTSVSSSSSRRSASSSTTRTRGMVPARDASDPTVHPGS